jgi:uncharacterized protein involved in response to NO
MPGIWVNSPFWGRGFRPFFLSAAVYSIYTVLAWSGFYQGLWPQPGGMADPLLWHAHEMVYGFAMAVVAGFLLTAVANWTGGAPARQWHLLSLWLLWLAGRIAMNVPEISPLSLAIVDSLFIPALAISLAWPLLRSRNIRNFIFLILLTVLFSANISFHALHSKYPVYGALMIILMMIALVGGRVIPAFAVAALRRRGHIVYQHDQRILDTVCIALMAGSAASAGYFGLQSVITAYMFLSVSAVLALRMRRYHVIKSFCDPMLWILQVSYGWIVAGFLLMALSSFDILPVSTALHALTVGGIGGMCLGMMSRVTRGHTGRDIIADRLTVVSFILMQGAALVRVAAPVLLAEYYTLWLAVSGLLWAASYGIYLLVYFPMLVRPRPDGLPA